MNTVDIKTLLSGTRNIILSIYLKSDGISGELESEVLIDPEDYGMGKDERLRLVGVEYSFAGFDAVLEFDAGGVTPNFKWVLSESSNQGVDFSKYGNLVDDSGVDGTQKLMLSTTGFTSSTDQGSILLHLRK